MKDYFFGVAILAGTIIGVGMFSLPIVTCRAGVVSFLFFIIAFGLIQYYIHLLFTEITLRTKEIHRLPGYAGIYLGRRQKLFLAFVDLLGNYGTILAYIIIGGIFAFDLLSPYLGGDIFIYSSFLFLVQAIALLFGLKMLASLEFALSLMLIAVVFLISFKGWPNINPANLPVFNFKDAFLPYGAVLFSVSGISAIPILRKLFAGNERKLKKIIKWGTLIPVAIMIVFSLMVVAITGEATTSDTLSGLLAVLGDGIILFSLIFGLLTIATSFLMVSEATKEIYMWDFKIGGFLAWTLSVWPPYFLFVIGWQDLIKVISLSGGILGSLMVFYVLWICYVAKRIKQKRPNFSVPLPRWIFYTLSFVFIFGAIISLIINL